MRDAPNLAAFTDVHAALAFAYRHRHGDYPANTLRSLGPKRPTEEPTLPSGQDAAALAGWVLQVVEGSDAMLGLVEPYRSMVLARYCVDPQRNIAAKLRVLDEVLHQAVGTGLHKRRMVDLLVQRYFGGQTHCPDGKKRPIRQHQIADACDVSQPTVSQMWRKVAPWLREQERRAEEMLYLRLQHRGLVS